MSDSKRWVGDFLLLIGPERPLPKARLGGSWILENKAKNSRLYISNPVSGWRGSPLSAWSEGSFHYWLLGEVWGQRPASSPQDWPGHFLLLGYDTGSDCWHIWTNRCGTFHAYYTLSASSAAAGSYFPAVASFSVRDLDMESLAGFFKFGFFPAERTYYKDIIIIRPAVHLVFNQNGEIAHHEKLHTWQHQPDERLSFDDAVDAFAGIFHQVIKEQVTGRRVAFPISGGLDSRSTVAALPDNAQPDALWGYSYGYTPGSPETQIAGKIAAARQLPFKAYTIQPYLFEKLPSILDAVEGFQDVTQCRQAFITEELASHAEYVMAAHWGDVWLDDAGIYSAASQLDNDQFIEACLKKFTRPGSSEIPGLFKQDAQLPDADIVMRKLLEQELKPLMGIADQDFRLKALKTELWSFRWTTASLRMYQPGAFPLLPFYDPRLVDFFCTIPTAYVSKRRLQIEYLKRYAPDLARITWQKFDANLYWYNYFNTLLLPRRAFKKLMRRYSNHPIIQRNWEVQLLNSASRRGLEEYLLSSGLRLHDLVSRARLGSYLDAFYSHPTASNGYAISMLLTFSAWLETYGN